MFLKSGVHSSAIYMIKNLNQIPAHSVENTKSLKCKKQKFKTHRSIDKLTRERQVNYEMDKRQIGNSLQGNPKS